jgi:hypothetical protein
MTLTRSIATLALVLFASPSIPAQLPEPGRIPQTQNTDSQSVQGHIITVSRSGEAYAKPDLGILVMSIQSTSPIASEAVADNGQKTAAVESALAGLGSLTTATRLPRLRLGKLGEGVSPASPTSRLTTRSNTCMCSLTPRT